MIDTRTKSFNKQVKKLPKQIVAGVEKMFSDLKDDPDDMPSVHPLHDSKRGSHKKSSFSVSMTRSYRLLFVKKSKNERVWYWAGSHEDYNKFCGSRRR